MDLSCAEPMFRDRYTKCNSNKRIKIQFLFCNGDLLFRAQLIKFPYRKKHFLFCQELVIC